MIFFQLNRESPIPLSRQLYEQLQLRIVSGELLPGYRLPSSRRFARDHGISRNLVTEVYETLVIEGYLESRTGAGTFVSSGAVLKSFRPRLHESEPEEEKSVKVSGVRFETGIPASLFPRGHWGRCLRDAVLYGRNELFGYGYTNGIPELQTSLRTWLGISKGIDCRKNQIMIFPGTHQAVRLLMELFTDDDRWGVIEDPLLPSLRTLVLDSGGKILPVPLDEEGMKTGEIPRDLAVKYLMVTPSHNFPLSGIMTIQRRIELIDYVRRTGAWIIENDYDGELIYKGPVLSSLYLLAPDKVIHIGSFSGTMYPGLKIAYMIVPQKLVESVVLQKERLRLTCPHLEQLALARFMDSGYYDAHVSRLKKHYFHLYRHLAARLNACFSGRVEILGIGAGQYLTARFPGTVFDEDLRKKLEKAGFSAYFGHDTTSCPGDYADILVFSFGMLDKEEISRGVDILADVLNHC
ncbi:PLP-dependent aminotransferase family protein [Marispirochaeta sp.]|uniref:MocR-like pyridoxine biosynthesis transcription factor PdxR n=1 Tax=Marispirochaeta sp. TaxID=2038653 RepID=UPI0029C65689|nr:PLP-dependent aminotransferase family protein [Marispirochaeta sp.]